jgi:hypothetical protein
LKAALRSAPQERAMRFPTGDSAAAGGKVDVRNAAGRRDIDPSNLPAQHVLAAFANVSRRIHDLARELKCLGYFDDGDDRPRAA